MAWVDADAAEERTVIAGDGSKGDSRRWRPSLRSVEERLRRMRGRKMDERLRERMVHLTELLPEGPRLLMRTYFETRMTMGELAVLHGMSPRAMRRRIERLQETLLRPCFVAAAQHAGELPGALAELARGHWLEGRTMRELAAERRESLHRVRVELATARVLLEQCAAARRGNGAGRLRSDEET